MKKCRRRLQQKTTQTHSNKKIGNKISKLFKDECRLYWQVFARHSLFEVSNKVCQNEKCRETNCFSKLS